MGDDDLRPAGVVAQVLERRARVHQHLRVVGKDATEEGTLGAAPEGEGEQGVRGVWAEALRRRGARGALHQQRLRLLRRRVERVRAQVAEDEQCLLLHAQARVGEHPREQRDAAGVAHGLREGAAVLAVRRVDELAQQVDRLAALHLVGRAHRADDLVHRRQRQLVVGRARRRHHRQTAAAARRRERWRGHVGQPPRRRRRPAAALLDRGEHGVLLLELRLERRQLDQRLLLRELLFEEGDLLARVERVHGAVAERRQSAIARAQRVLQREQRRRSQQQLRRLLALGILLS